MINPQDLQLAVVTKLREIPALLDLVGDEHAIQAYDDESQINGTLENAEFSMLGTSVLVGWTGAELPREGETRGWTHHLKIVLNADGILAYFTLAQTILDGTAEGDCDSFLNSEIHPDCDGIQNAELTPEPGDDRVGRLSLSFTLTEK